jgi:hypothetical protein
MHEVSVAYVCALVIRMVRLVQLALPTVVDEFPGFEALEMSCMS